MANKKKTARAGGQITKKATLKRKPYRRTIANAEPGWRTDMLVDIHLANSQSSDLAADSFWLLVAGVNFKLGDGNPIGMFYTQQVNPKANPLLTPFDTMRLFMVFPGIADFELTTGRPLDLVPGGYVGMAQFDVNEENIRAEHFVLGEGYNGPLDMRQLCSIAKRAQLLTKTLAGGSYAKTSS